jgi:soluble lytic murein transglycosylase-like protein/LysM repeat protein
MKQLNEFFRNIKKYKILNFEEKSPLNALFNRNNISSIKKVISEDTKTSNFLMSAIMLSIAFYAIKDNKVDNQIEEHLNKKIIITETSDVDSVEVDFVNNSVTVNNSERIIVPALNEVQNSNLFELNWDYKTPPKKFEKYYSEEYSNILPSRDEINEIENFYGIEEDTIYYMAQKESRYSLNAVSHKNAKGLVGFLESTAREFNLIKKDKNGKEVSYINNGYASVDTAARYLLWINGYVNGKNANLLDKTKDDKGFDNLDYTLASYNAGHTKVFIKSKNNTHKKRIPNYKETREYIRDIQLLLSEEGYVILKNDSLEKISKKFDINIDTIVRNNYEINNNHSLKYGNVLNIKNNPNEEILLEIEKGFSMSKISKNTGINLTELLTYNNLKANDIINIGDNIKLPPINISKTAIDNTVKNYETQNLEVILEMPLNNKSTIAQQDINVVKKTNNKNTI